MTTLTDIPPTTRWMKELYYDPQHTAFKDSTNFAHIKTHYYWSHTLVRLVVPFHLHVLLMEVDQSPSDRALWSCPGYRAVVVSYRTGGYERLSGGAGRLLWVRAGVSVGSYDSNIPIG